MKVNTPWHRTKIVCTLGPATDRPGVLERMIRAGMDVARINTSHGEMAEHARRIRQVRRAAKRLGHPVAILIDLPGPKWRVGRLAQDQLELETGQRVALGHAPKDATVIPVTIPRLLKAARPGQAIYLADGAVKLRVEAVRDRRVICRVLDGGTIRSGAGINLPDSTLSMVFPTKGDIRQIGFAVRSRAEWIGVSFVRSAQDVQHVRAHVPKSATPLIMAKIEKPQALSELGSIVEAADGVMVARGDLGVETDLAQVPLAQKRIIALANARARPVITATQMLESMVHNAQPTRAEVTDVANAVLDGTDGVMLSAETAIGEFPVEAVETLNRVLTATEADYPYGTALDRLLDRLTKRLASSFDEAISFVACRLSFDLNARAIIVPAEHMADVTRIARLRPRAPILAMTRSAELQRKLAAVWGVVPLLLRSAATTDTCVAHAKRWLAAKDLGHAGDPVIMLSSRNPSQGFSDTLQVVQLP